MDTQTLTRFFLWCTVIDGGLLILWAIFFLWGPDFVYRIMKRGFSLSREKHDEIFYLLLGVFKIFFLVFNLVPYLALRIIG
ncbi:MAG TPA: hypothetical protein ENN17_03620 [bacterium]|nr:hypothetical protein [bacterium]